MVSEEIGGLLARMNSTNLDGDDEADVDQDAIAERTRHLEKALESLKQLWDYRSAELEELFEKLGTGSRDASWRIPIGDSGILDYALELLPHDEFELGCKIQALRLIGNSCADTEENRARVVQGAYIPVIAGLLGPGNSDDLLPYVITSLHNICVDYEPAQTQAGEAELAQSLTIFLDTPRLTFSPHLVGITSKTIALLASTDKEKENANVSTPLNLLRLASDPFWPSRSDSLAADDFCNLVSAATTYLTNERLLAAAAASKYSAIVFDALQTACTRYSCAKLEDMDDADRLSRVRKSLVGTLADLTGRDEFVSRRPAPPKSHEPTARALLADWLRGSPRSHLQEAACLALGNLACSDDAATLLVRRERVHKSLVELLGAHYPYEPGPDDTVPSALLHAAVGLLKNLAIAPANKPVLGAALLKNPKATAATTTTAVLPRLWGLADTQPQTLLATVSLCRLLLAGTPANGALLCAPLRQQQQQQQQHNDDDDKNNNNNNTTTTTTADVRTNVHAILDLFRRTDPEPTKTECARTAMALCRLLHQSDADEMLPSPAWAPSSPPPSSSSTPSRRAAFYDAHAGLDELLSFLLVQTRFPALRSEAWFVLALMSRSPDGAKVVARALTRTEAALAALMTAAGAGEGSATVEAGEEKSGGPGEEAAAELGIGGLGLEPRQADPKQAASMARVDRENVLVLLTELLRNQVDDDLSEDHRRKFEAALRTGGGMVLDERAKASGTGGSSA